MTDFAEQNEAITRLEEELEKLRSGTQTIQELLEMSQGVLKFAEILKDKNSQLIQRIQDAVENFENTTETSRQTMKDAASEFSASVAVLKENGLPDILMTVQDGLSKIQSGNQEIQQQIQAVANQIQTNNTQMLDPVRASQKTMEEIHQELFKQSRNIKGLLQLVEVSFFIGFGIPLLVAIVLLVAKLSHILF